MKKAVCLLAERNGRYLAVSRRNDPNRWGFPGGKVDENEFNVEALQREANEEVGVLAPAVSYEPLFSDKCSGEVDFWVTTYLFVDPCPIMDMELVAEEGLLIDWKERFELCHPDHSPFWEYNIKAFEAYDRYRA